MNVATSKVVWPLGNSLVDLFHRPAGHCKAMSRDRDQWQLPRKCLGSHTRKEVFEAKLMEIQNRLNRDSASL